MYYNSFKDMKISALGFGAMRLPVVDGKDDVIDEAATQEMVDAAVAGGVNYFDTAWGYHGGNSETVISRCLRKYPRDSYYLASKFPGYDLNNMPKVEEIFEKQLEKCGVEYFDFYLFHNVCELNINQYLDPQYGIYDYLIKQKKNGRIRHLGFSAHGSMEVIERFLNAYGKDMEFCQLQLNWLDWEFQQAGEKAALAAKWGLPVIVMEPLRGGSLCKLSDEHVSRIAEICPGDTLPAVAFRFLQSLDNTPIVLSGMSNLQQMKENMQTYDRANPLNSAQVDTLMEIAREKTSATAVPCTACHYCTSHCPMELDIPALLNLYNEHAYSGGGFIAPMALASYEENKKPNACIGCRSCEQVCPQQIKISEALADFVTKL